MEALRLAAHGLPVVIVNPSFVLGPDDPKGTSMELVRRFLLGRIPAYVDGGLNIVDVRDVAAATCSPTRRANRGSATSSPRATSRFDRLFADMARLSGREHAPVKLPGSIHRCWRSS